MTNNQLQSFTLDNFFDKIFYINLSKDTQRNDHIINQFDRYSITNFERVEAIQLTEYPPLNHYRNFIKNDPKYILGSLSCRASHLKCVELALERGYKQVLILEDDVLFLNNPNELLQRNVGALGNWDMLYFGGLIEPHFRNQIVCAHAYAIKTTIYQDILNMAISSGMEIDNFYAKILHHMSYNYNASGRYDIKVTLPFNQIVQNKFFYSAIQSNNIGS